MRQTAIFYAGRSFTVKNNIFTARTYILGAAGLGLLVAALRALCLALAFEGSYFTGSALPTVYRIVFLLALSTLSLFPALALRGKIALARAPLTPAAKGGAALAAIFAFACFIAACTISNASLPALLWLMGLLALLLTVIYFILQAVGAKAGDNAHAILGSATIFALACLVAFTYFDVSTPMNAPHKLELHVALLGAVLYLLYELRARVGISKPMALVTFSGLALFLTLSVSVSDIIGTVVGVFRDPLYLVQDLLLLALTVYIGARAFADATKTTSKG